MASTEGQKHIMGSDTHIYFSSVTKNSSETTCHDAFITSAHCENLSENISLTEIPSQLFWISIVMSFFHDDLWENVNYIYHTFLTHEVKPTAVEMPNLIGVYFYPVSRLLSLSTRER